MPQSSLSHLIALLFMLSGKTRTASRKRPSPPQSGVRAFAAALLFPFGVFICVLFLSACAGNQEDQVNHLELQMVEMTTVTTKTRSPSASPIKKARQSKIPLATATKNATNPAEPMSEAPQRVEIPFSLPFSPEGRTTPITTTLTPRNRLPEEKISQEPSQEASQEPKQAPELPPGNTVHFQASLDTDQENSFPFLATPDSLVLINTDPEAGLKLSVEVQDMRTRQVLQIFNQLQDQDTIVYKIPSEGGPLYRVLVKPVDGSKGNYRGFFIGSAGIGFSLLPSYGITGRLPEKGSLAYIYTGKAEPAVQFNLLPRPEDDLDLVVRIYKLSDLQTLLFEEGHRGVDEELQFLFTPPKEKMGTYLIMVQEASGNTGKFKMTIKKDDLLDSGDDLTHKIRIFF